MKKTLAGLVNLEKILELTTIHIYWLDTNNVYQGCNEQQAKSAGLASRLDIVGLTNSDLPWNKGHHDIVEKINKINLEVMRTGKPIFIEEPGMTMDDKYTVYLSHKLPLKNKLGKIIGLLGISIVITDQKIQKEKLQDEKEQAEFTLDYIIAHLPAHIYWKNRDGIYLGSNDSQAQSLGLTSSKEVIGKTDYDLPWGKENASKFRANDIEVMKTKNATSIEETALINGKQAIVLSQKLPLKNKKGEIVGVMGVSIDITDRKKMEEELLVAKERAETANEVKTQFIQNMEHDLRTPASGVAQMLQLLSEDELEPSKKEVLTQLASAAQRLLDLLNDIVAFDKTSSGQLSVSLYKFDLYDIVKSIVDMETPTAQSKNVTLKTEIAADVPQYIISDKTRVFRILLNLVGNAVKFTHKGYVKVSISIAKKIDAKHFILKIVVEDTGIGIPEEKRKRIYDRFERCVPSNRGLYPGSGLGLSITKQFVDELQGEIEVESSENVGTTFTCFIPCSIALVDMTNYENIFEQQQNQQLPQELPRETITPSLPAWQSSDKFNKINILVVEDDPIAQMSVRGTLEGKLCTNFALAKTGQEALNLIAKNKYDLIFMDLGLPDIIGTDVAKKIRETDQETPIIALTAHDKPNIRDTCKSVGMNDFMVKPLDIIKAKTILQKYLAKEKFAFSEPDTVPPSRDNTKILDFELCKRIANNDEDTAKQLWQVFSSLLPKYLSDIQEAYKNENITMLFNLTHKLKGAATYAGTPRLKDAASDLCEATRSETAKIKNITNLYQNLCAAISEAMRAYSELGY